MFSLEDSDYRKTDARGKNKDFRQTFDRLIIDKLVSVFFRKVENSFSIFEKHLEKEPIFSVMSENVYF